jgi:multiple sugar transport system substrate-binding protein
MDDHGTPEPREPSGIADRTVSRRRFLGGVAAVTGLAAAPSLLAACGPSGGASPTVAGGTAPGETVAPPASPTGEVTFGSNYSDASPKAALQDVFDAFTETTGITVKVNTVEHGPFQDQISSYLQGTPEDVFTWFAGFRMRFFAAQGLSTPITDIWSRIGSNYSEAFKAASTGDDGEQYFIPFYNYPWVINYRKSVWADNGYEIPATWDEFKTLLEKIQSDGLVPIAFADKDGWPAQGTFDILNLRQNGYQFHVDLMAGNEKWSDARVKRVFEVWKEIIPFLQQGALGRTWQEGAQAMFNGDAAMYFLGTFAGQQAVDEEQKADWDFFTYPTLGTDFDDEGAIDAPIDGFMLSKAPENLEGSKALLEYLSTGEAQVLFLAADPNNVAAANDADTSGYTEQQKKMAEIIGSAGAIAQYLDRDTRPDFAGPNGMQLFLQNFLTDPEQDLDAYLKTIQDFWDSLVA